MTRKEKEYKIVETMIDMYCEDHNISERNLVNDPISLSMYVEHRIKHCIWGNEKTTCGQCTTHCYTPKMREAIKKVMKYSGPRMIYRHPLMALYHLYYSLRRFK